MNSPDTVDTVDPLTGIAPAAVPIDEAFARVLDPASRPNPYPLYARLRSEPVSRQSDGTWVVSSHDDVAALLHDPRISANLDLAGAAMEGFPAAHSLIGSDPPNHERLRGAVMAHFTPDVVREHAARVRSITDELLDRAGTERPDGTRRIDVVDEVAHPLPVMVICRLLGVPHADEDRFRGWADTLARGADGVASLNHEEIAAVTGAATNLTDYLGELAAERAARPQDDLISGLVRGGPDTEPLTADDLLVTLRLLLVAGHETSVNLITNGMLTMLRHPDALDRLRRDPELVVPMVEELLRYEPPVQFRYRAARTDIAIGGRTIPEGALVVLLLASASRSGSDTDDPDRFVPDRSPNAHFGFGGGIHYCIGAPLARMEVHTVLPELVRRLVRPRLVADPPPYRPGAQLRGPEHLLVDVDGVLA